jgi:hypothetical protein
MYHFSRAIYRELAPYVLEDRPPSQRDTNRELFLRACERTMARLLMDHRHFAKPARSLFREVRIFFGLSDQVRAYMVIERNVALALEYVSQLPDHELDANGVQRCCEAMTRKGKPCQRHPLPGSEYCPSHQHLEEKFEELQLEEYELAA